MARQPPASVRAERRLTRSALWASGPRQLTLPIEARGLSEVTVASGSLAITPDYDVLAWLCERWLRYPTPSGWMCPTFYELGSDLYAGRPPSGKDYRTLRDSIRRLYLVSVEIFGFNAETGQAEPGTVYGDCAAASPLPADPAVAAGAGWRGTTSYSALRGARRNHRVEPGHRRVALAHHGP